MSPNLPPREDPLANRAVFAAVLILFVTVAMAGTALVMRWVYG